jgi:magnesium chelatase family protein
LLDRVDALIEVPPLTLTDLDDRSALEPSASVRERVETAREFRRVREERARSGQRIPLGSRRRPVGFSGDAGLLLREALVRDGLSGRAYMRVTSLARTIADLDELDEVGAEHVAEALSLRLDHRRLTFS